jgi:acyl-CoA thioesterase-1
MVMTGRWIHQWLVAGKRRLLWGVCWGICLALPAAHTAAAGGPAALAVIGDSISAEYGLPHGSGWVELLRQRLRSDGFDYNVVNASISGDTTSGGRARLGAVLAQHRPAVVLIELGGNDGLRGVPLATAEANLQAMIDASRAAGAQVLLVGMRIPPSYGPDYAEQFHAMYGRLAQRNHVALVPFLLKGIVEKPELFQQDRIHPTVAAQQTLMDNVYPVLRPLLASLARHDRARPPEQSGGARGTAPPGRS